MFKALDITKGDLHLLGPITSVGGFSIGPYYVYLLALLSFITGLSPITNAYLSVILGVVGIGITFFVIKDLVSEKSAMLICYLMAISISFISWDQMPWTPSLFYISQIILVYGVVKSLKKQWGYLLVALGVSIGFSSHVGIFLSLIPVFVFYLLARPVKINLKYLLLTILILLGGFLPNIIFDVRHNFENVLRMLTIFKGDGLDYFVGFGKIIKTLSFSVVPLFYPRSMNNFDAVIVRVIFALIIVNTLRLATKKETKKLSMLLLLSVVLPSLYFYLTQGKFSEYYLIMTIPSLIIMASQLIQEVNSKKVMFSILIISTILNFDLYKKMYVPFNLAAKEKVAQEIKSMAGGGDYGISLTTRHGEQFGFDYLFSYYDLKADVPPKKGQTKIFTIVIPEGFDGVNGMKDFDGVGLIWQGL